MRAGGIDAHRRLLAQPPRHRLDGGGRAGAVRHGRLHPPAGQPDAGPVLPQPDRRDQAARRRAGRGRVAGHAPGRGGGRRRQRRAAADLGVASRSVPGHARVRLGPRHGLRGARRPPEARPRPATPGRLASDAAALRSRQRPGDAALSDRRRQPLPAPLRGRRGGQEGPRVDRGGRRDQGARRLRGGDRGPRRRGQARAARARHRRGQQPAAPGERQPGRRQPVRVGGRYLVRARNEFRDSRRHPRHRAADPRGTSGHGRRRRRSSPAATSSAR